ncbi:MAG: septum formation protein Maf [Nanoarchaeota archaeon]|nr:septum formation protein Maf [Nanoarchaeota archaeon]|tara:strand:+ start:1154 stop:1720 length:567 start_codon:yes stop_codon:yes gene_type:complete
MKIVLGSQSPFRKHALDVLGLDYETVPSHFDEKSIRDDNPLELAKKLSEAKARSLSERHPDAIIVTGDLFVVYQNKVYEKPKSEGDAFDMLKLFSGSMLEIVTGLAVYNPTTDHMLSTVEKCEVTFRELIDTEINDYISRYPVLKCAGSFEADGLLRFAETIQGKYTFRAGLPVNELVLFLREHGVNI